MYKECPVKNVEYLKVNNENRETHWKELVEVEGLSHFLLDTKLKKNANLKKHPIGCFFTHYYFPHFPTLQT